MANNDDLILRGKALKDLRGIKDVLVAQGDPILASILNRAIECIENQPAAPALIMKPVRKPFKECGTCAHCEELEPCLNPASLCAWCDEICACKLCVDYSNWRCRDNNGQ